MGLVFSLALASPAQAVSPVMWDETSDDNPDFSLTGTLNGVGVTLQDSSTFEGVGERFETRAFTGANYNPELTGVIAAKFLSSFTVTFDSAINFRAYLFLPTIDDNNLQLSSSFDQSPTRTISGNSGQGIFEFQNINSLTLIVERPTISAEEMEGSFEGFVTFTEVPFGFNDGVVTMVGIACFGGLKGLESWRRRKNRDKSLTNKN